MTSAPSPRSCSDRPTSPPTRLISHNKKAVEQIAEALIEKKELFGDELVEILESAKLKIPKIDLTEAKAWPAV